MSRRKSEPLSGGNECRRYNLVVNAERYQAYTSAVSKIDKVAAAKLHPQEQEVLKNAAEGLLLCSDPEGSAAAELRAEAQRQLFSLVEAGRWSQSRADELLEAIEACCPFASAFVGKTAE